MTQEQLKIRIAVLDAEGRLLTTLLSKGPYGLPEMMEAETNRICRETAELSQYMESVNGEPREVSQFSGIINNTKSAA